MKKVLITGASGFLGQHTLARLRHIHPSIHIRAMVRPSTSIESLGWGKDENIQVIRADLLSSELHSAVSDVDTVIHLAAVMRGTDEAIKAGTIQGTLNLLEAMSQASIKHLILCSSFSVYNYRSLPKDGLLTEDTPLLTQPDMARRNAYTIAKTQQEQHVRAWAKAEDAQLTVLRPGFIWGPGHLHQPFVLQLGPLTVAIGPHRPLALSYVDNCADAIVRTTFHTKAIGETFNVVDREEVTPQQYVQDTITHKKMGATLPLPYNIAYIAPWLATLVQKRMGGPKLPSILNTHRFEPRFKPFRAHKEKLQDAIGWQQPVSYQEAVQRVR